MPPRSAAEPWPRRPNALVVLSGRHETLPESEVRACAPCRVVARRQRLLLIETPFPTSLHRLAYAAMVLDFLGVGSFDRLPFEAMEVVRGTYAVRDGGVPAERRREIRRLVWSGLAEPQVSLRRPDTELHAFAMPDGVWWGRLRWRAGEQEFAARQTQRRPFFRSYGMQPRKSRCLVNLSGVRPGQRLLDPCCGTGGFLIEAALMGIEAYGSDRDAQAVAGTRTNLEALGLQARLLHLDARRMDAWSVSFDAVVSDLPYGVSASTAGVGMGELYAEILRAAALVLRRGRAAVLVAPEGALPAAPDEFLLLERHLEFVHDGLTREISVLCRR